MRAFRFVVIVISIVFLFSSCAPSSPTPTPVGPVSEGAEPTATPAPTAVQSAQQALAQLLGVNVQDVQIVSTEQVDWPDACLGLSFPGQMCAQMVTPGYKVTLDVAGQHYEYHTDMDGEHLELAVAPEPTEKDLVLSWHREGGVAGFCDDLKVYRTGDVSADSCKSGESQNIASARLSFEQLQTLQGYTDRLSSFQLEQTDDAVADAMTVRVTFTGTGSEEATDADKDAIRDWAAELFAAMAVK